MQYLYLICGINKIWNDKLVPGQDSLTYGKRGFFFFLIFMIHYPIILFMK